VDRELDEELHDHIEQKTKEYAAGGMNPKDARRAALLELGGIARVAEECRDTRRVNWIQDFLQDLRYGLRMLRKSPGFAAVAILTLALGIGANTAIFSLVNAVMLQSLPVRNPGQLVVPRWSAHEWPKAGTSSFGDCVDRGGPRPNSGLCSFSYPMFKEIRAQNEIFSGVAAFAGPAQLDLSGNGTASMASGELVSGDYFQTLGVRAAIGRMLEPSDEQPGAAPVVVLNYGYWQSAFGGAAGAIGKAIRLNGVAFTIVGVTDPRFTRLTPGKSLDMWLPLTQLVPLGLPWGGISLEAGNWWLTLVGRLKPGTRPGEAEAAVSLLFRNETLHGEKPAFKESDDPRVSLLPAQKRLAGFRADYGEPLYLLMAAVGMVLLIACANVAGLMLARARAREKEIAVRLALGAGRGRVIRQLLTESVLLSAAGAALGVLVAFWGATGLAAFLSANSYHPLDLDLHPDATVLLFTVGVALLTGIGFGLAPALRATRINVAPALKENSGSLSAASHVGNRRFGLGNSLVVAQVALSMVVLIGAGLLLRTLEKLKSINPGFDTRNILLFSVDPALAGYKEENIQNVYDEMERRLVALPGVVSASYSSDALLDGGLWSSDVHLRGQAEKSRVDVQMLAVGPDFFETMRIPLLQGRTFRATDARSTKMVAVVNQALVRKFPESRDPFGLDLMWSDHQMEIVGVVADTKYDRLQKEDEPTLYIPLKSGEVTFALRTAPAPANLIPAVRHIVNEVDENLPVFGVRTQSQTIDRLLFNERLVARLSSLFGLLALVLTCIGLYGLLSYEVARRTREIGIRAALGAQRRDVLMMVVGQGLSLVFFGALVGMVAAFGVTRYLQSLLFGVRPTDPVTFLAVCVTLAIVALLACYIPARRAMRVDPMVALRHE
jgi:predicted permease